MTKRQWFLTIVSSAVIALLTLWDELSKDFLRGWVCGMIVGLAIVGFFKGLKK